MFPNAGLVASLPHEVAVLFKIEEKVVEAASRRWDLSSASDQVDAYVSSWSSRYHELKPSSDGKYHVSYDVLKQLVGNPVHVFTLMDRMVNLLPQIMEEMTGEDLREVREILDSEARLPDSSDLMEAQLALVRIQFAYKLVDKRLDK